MPKNSKPKKKEQKSYPIYYKNMKVDMIPASSPAAAKKKAMKNLKAVTKSKWQF